MTDGVLSLYLTVLEVCLQCMLVVFPACSYPFNFISKRVLFFTCCVNTDVFSFISAVLLVVALTLQLTVL